jgi:hypothetical protein
VVLAYIVCMRTFLVGFAALLVALPGCAVEDGSDSQPVVTGDEDNVFRP